MAGEEIRLGPFVGGLNTYSDPTAISDTSLAEAVNFEMDEDGAYVNRPPFFDFGGAAGPIIPNGTSQNSGFEILGYYSSPGGAHRLIATNNVDGTYWFDGTRWTSITNRVISAITQYREDLWMICPQGGGVGGKWSPSSGFTEVPNIPRGDAIISHKDRLWVAAGKSATSNGSRLFMSTIVSAAVNWPASPGVFFDVNPGDGQNAVDIVVYNSDIVVFKERSTYRFSYASDPSTGTLSKISSTIGIADKNCFAEYENSVYLLHSNKVYMFVNYNFEELNSKVPLRANERTEQLWQPYSLSIWADRLIVQYYDEMFVYKLKTRTWSMWQSKNEYLKYIGKFWHDPASPSDRPSAYLTSSRRAVNRIFQITDGVSNVAEDMDCHVTTKNYDYNTSSRFKRLFWWGVDIVANVSIRCELLPVFYGQRRTWEFMSQFTWGEATGTWAEPAPASRPDYTYAVPVGGLSFGRKFVKLPQAIRFRQLAFRVSGTTKGDIETAPLKLFSITTFVKDKQKMVKKIS